jgi:Ca2+-binding RTX toxin-like protein
VQPIQGPATGVRGQTRSFTGAFTDPGTLDTHSVHWDFGDGATATFAATDPGALTPSHVYTTAGAYTVTLTITDDDAGDASVVHQIQIKPVELQADPLNPAQKMLVIGGTLGNDLLLATPAGRNGVRVRLAGSSGTFSGTFNGAGRIVVYAQAGNDSVLMADGPLPAEIHGGAGNDLLVSGRGSDILLGEEGNDGLYGGTGRDLLIGGDGADVLFGGPEDDILIAGTTQHDADQAALRALLAEWTSARSYATRIKNLRNGSGSATRANGPYFLQAAVPTGVTVFDDADVDVLTGGSGSDWWFFNRTGLVRDKATDAGLESTLDIRP